MFRCKDCQELLPSTEYYYNSTGGRHHACKKCIKKRNVERYNNNPELQEKRKAREDKYKLDENWLIERKLRSEKFYKSIEGRARTLFKSAKRRESKFNEVIDFDYLWILDKLKVGVCEVTGVPFDFNKPVTTNKNPFAPSIDRKDSSKGYCKENVRIVIWQYNLMKGEISDEQLITLCRIIVDESENQNRLDI